MKKYFIILITMLTFVISTNAQQTTSAVDDDAVIFIKNFYEEYFSNDGWVTDARIEQLCTPKLLKKLKDLNDYDDGGYDVSLFRSQNQEGNGESLLKGVRNVSGLTYLADILDMGHAVTIKLTLVKTANGSFKIDDVDRAAILSDFPIGNILKLIDYEVEAGDILVPAGYKYVGEYSSEAARAVMWTWCKNCVASKTGEVRQFQKGTSSIVCEVMQMGSPTTLTIEVFNTNARDAVITELKASYFVEDKGGAENEKSFSRNNGLVEVTANMNKSKKGWKFTIFPVACQ